MPGPSRSGARAAWIVALLALGSACDDGRSASGARCTAPSQCRSGLCLQRTDTLSVCVDRCSSNSDCAATDICGRFNFQGLDEAGVPSGVESDIVRVCRPRLQPACDGSCSAGGGACFGESAPVCVAQCRDSIDCSGRACVRDGCGSARCVPACDDVRDCPAYYSCDLAFVGSDGHGRCIPIAPVTDAGASFDAAASTCGDGG